ncbi:methyltransferase domain-containing protein [Iningainema sp. BLCCT55]|uniref:Methyltransferase domain-containing protein n=1 Tax=Iningainema tapete BLCC-T55 TaxID=2748662 RepID=A0A8J6XDK4_9CYAN|nr:methyltransferase domain-containing protein [Iningainema tapete BLCC-T55]
MQNSINSEIEQYVSTDAQIDWQTDIPTCTIPMMTKGMLANINFFGHPVWSRQYLQKCYNNETFKPRWQAAMGSWDGKIVVDIGCGPGNLYAKLGGSPKVIIGVDIARGGLEIAKEIGYTPILADAHHLPFIDQFADIVVANSTIHHCDDMRRMLAEAARIVRPGGLLVTDKDPQKTAWNLKGLALFLRDIRMPIYRLIRSKYYVPPEIRNARWKTEIHNQRPGDGVTPELYHQVLEPLGFEVKLYPHNHDLGAEVLEGKYGRLPLKLRLAQRMSGINPDSPAAAQTIMCVAKRIS